MPIKDPVRRKEVHQAWAAKKMAEGYGKALYSRRKLRFENEVVLRIAVENAALQLRDLKDALTRRNGPEIDLEHEIDSIKDILDHAIERAPEVTGKPLDYMPIKQEEK